MGFHDPCLMREFGHRPGKVERGYDCALTAFMFIPVETSDLDI